MWFWNRREIYTGFDMAEFNRIRQALRSRGVDCDYRVANIGSGSRRFGSGTFGEDPRYRFQYYLYVHKNAYEDALFILNQKAD